MAATEPHNISIKCGKKLPVITRFFFTYFGPSILRPEIRVIIFVYHMITKVLSKGMQFYIYGLIITLLPHISLLVPNFPNPNSPLHLPLSFFHFSPFVSVYHIPFHSPLFSSLPHLFLSHFLPFPLQFYLSLFLHSFHLLTLSFF